MKHGEPKITNVIPRRAGRLSPAQCAKATNLSERTICAAIASGALPSKGGKVKLADLNAWRRSAVDRFFTRRGDSVRRQCISPSRRRN